ncbi:FVYE domain-containing protein [Heterostelium album PN500]|uniref:FVYE domain-containing protein n=1 Tax=Heterostelium pallidum (strain ATCC 26659 / Pp 5 / PN500) TaxID=670386 RepID=D3BFC3_HETP5|nr:FVYE domain-containing protein [Heterostelium album PN500]EFA79837.1 FVYE domain-containing protein [Heterostelium album PN500]|eukprot:XP_020431958.1 FVYE domain-containing protein [Heterostelium album PN500]
MSQKIESSSSSPSVEKPEWKPDQSALECTSCKSPFTLIRRRHHCRKCGSIFCDPCSNFYSVLPAEFGYSGQQRLCKSCHSFFEQKRQFFDTDAIVAQLQLRSSSNYEYSKPLNDIGNTKNGLRKSYILSKHTGSGDEYLITVTTPGTTCPWPMNSEKHKQKFIKTVLALKHKYIYPVSSVEIAGSNDKVFLFKKYCSKGSLKDIIYKAKPSNVYDSKYTHSLKKSYSTGVTVKLMPRYGRQLLDALIYLKQRGIAFTHLHSGNVLFKDDTCYLTDVENSLLGLKPYYYEYINGKENAEVICFGHVMFECIVGVPLAEIPIGNFASVIPDNVMELLKFIFVDANRTNVSLEDLVKHPYFNQVKIEDSSATDGKLKKSQLAFVKDYCNRVEQPAVSPRGPGVMKKQASSASMFGDTPSSSHSSSGTSTYSTTSTAPPQPSFSTLPPKASTSSTNLLKSANKLSSSTDLNQLKTSTAAPAPPPPPALSGGAAPPPPPPPPKAAKDLPKQEGRNALLDSIRNPNNFKNLKKAPQASPSKSSGIKKKR